MPGPGVCDYDRWDTDAFLAGSASREVWLFDRVTAMYRGYAITGARGPLESAYREAGLYRRGLTGDESKTRIGVPGAADDLKYHYSQGLAFHYLTTGDVRYREAAEDVALRAPRLVDRPGLRRRRRLLDRAPRRLRAPGLRVRRAGVRRSRRAVRRLGRDRGRRLPDGARQLPGELDPIATPRCFAHSATAHGESYGYVGCSPWMSAILADGLEAHARRVGGARADRARAGLVKLGRIIARDGRDPTGRPYYWMGLGRAGEGRRVRRALGRVGVPGRDGLVLRRPRRRRAADRRRRAGDRGCASAARPARVRSFNWQCRAAVQAPAYLR
jgi:hypothetical protein